MVQTRYREYLRKDASYYRALVLGILVCMTSQSSLDHDRLINHEVRIEHVEGDIKEIRSDYVSKIENAPTKSIALGMASIVLTSFCVGIVGLIFSFLK